MASTRTSDEAAAAGLTGAELVRVVQGGVDARTTTGAIAALAAGAAAGDRAGLIYNWSTDVANSDPTAGKIKGNNAAIGSITTLRIDDLEANTGANLDAIFPTWVVNDTLTIRSNSPTGTTIAVFTLTGSPAVTDRTGWWDIGVTGGVGTLPTNGEAIAIQHSKAGIGSGVDGDKGGFRFTAETTDATLSTVASGQVKFNHATQASATSIAIHDTTADAQALTTYMNTWRVGGRIILRSNTIADGSFFIFDLTSVTDSGNYFTLGGSVIANQSFTDGEAIVLEYIDSAEAPTYTSLDDATLPAAATNTNLIVSLGTVKAANTTGKKALAISNGTTYQIFNRYCFYDDRTTKTFIPVNSAITWSVSAGGAGSAFCVLTSSGAHGLTTGATHTGVNLHVASASTGWAANTLIPIDSVTSTTVILTTVPIASLAGTAPVLTALSGDILMATLPIPPALATSQFNIYPTYSMTNNANATKNFAIKIGTTYAGSVDLFRTTSGLASSAGNSSDWCFYNKNLTNSQETRGATANVTQFGNMAAHNTSNVETSGGAANIYLVATSGTINDVVGYRSIFAEMTA